MRYTDAAGIVKGLSLRNRINPEVFAKVSSVKGNRVNLACRDRRNRWTLVDCFVSDVLLGWQEA